MALNGTTSTVDTNLGAYSIYLTWSATQNIGGNYTDVTAILHMKTNSYGYIPYTSNDKGYIIIDGTKYNFSNPSTISYNQTKEVFRATKRVNHNADGSKVLSIGGNYTKGTGSVNFTLTVPNTNFTLTTIPRASTPRLSSASQNVGSEITIYTDSASTSFTHTVYWYFGNLSGRIDQGITTSKSWTLPTSIANQLPNANNGKGIIRLITYNGGTEVGRKDISFTAVVPSNSTYNPTATGLTASIDGAGRDKTLGMYVQGISKVSASFIPTVRGGATIRSQSITILGTSYDDKSVVSNILNKGGTVSIVASVTDSRGRNATQTISIAVQNYNSPQISIFNTERIRNTDKVDIYRKITWSNLDTQNPLNILIQRRAGDSTIWTTVENVNSTTGDIDSTITFSGLSDGLSYDFKIIVTDSFDRKIEVISSIGTASVPISISKTGVGIGKIWEKGALDINGGVYVDGDITVGGTLTSSFGYIAIPAYANLNDYQTTGFYNSKSDSDALTMSNTPPNPLAFTLVVEEHAGIKQTYTSYHTISSRIYMRNLYNGVWGQWKEIITTENGYNSMGSYTKFSDGTMLCWVDLTRTNIPIDAAYGGGLYRGLWNWVYPAPFIEKPSVTVSRFKWGTGLSWGFANANNTIEASLVALDVSSRATGTNVQISATAIGRWR